MSRTLISSGSPFEPTIGFSRAVRVGPHVAVAGTGPVAQGGGTDGVGDVARQTRRCLDIALAALAEAGGRPEHVTRTRILLTDIALWSDAAKVHGEVFGDIRPGCTVMQVSAFVDPDWLVEIEVDAIITEDVQ